MADITTIYNITAFEGEALVFEAAAEKLTAASEKIAVTAEKITGSFEGVLGTDEIGGAKTAAAVTAAVSLSLFMGGAAAEPVSGIAAFANALKETSEIITSVKNVSGALSGTANLLSMGFGILTGNTAAASAAMFQYNSALLASPITWWLAVIMLIVAAFYAVVAVINKVAGTTISATGIIFGCLNVVWQFIWNLAKSIANVLVGIFNWVEAVCFNIRAAFHNSIESVKGFFWGLLATATEVIAGIAQKLNELPFVSIDVSGLTGAAEEFRAKAEAAENNKLEYKDTKQAFMDGFNTLEVFQDGWVKDAFNSGYSFGEGLTAKDGGASEDVFTNVSGIYADTGVIAESVGATQEEIKYLREIAEREAINRFTTAEIKVDMSNMNNSITNGMDIDGVINHLALGASEALQTAAEGVHRA